MQFDKLVPLGRHNQGSRCFQNAVLQCVGKVIDKENTYLIKEQDQAPEDALEYLQSLNLNLQVISVDLPQHYYYITDKVILKSNQVPQQYNLNYQANTKNYQQIQDLQFTKKSGYKIFSQELTYKYDFIIGIRCLQEQFNQMRPFSYVRLFPLLMSHTLKDLYGICRNFFKENQFELYFNDQLLYVIDIPVIEICSEYENPVFEFQTSFNQELCKFNQIIQQDNYLSLEQEIGKFVEQNIDNYLIGLISV